MDEVEAKLLEYLNGAEALILSKAPVAYQATLDLVRINSFITLFVGILFAAAAIVVFRFGQKMTRPYSKDAEDFYPLWIVFAIPIVALAVSSCAHLFNRTALIGIFNPELALLHDVYNRLFGAN